MGHMGQLYKKGYGVQGHMGNGSKGGMGLMGFGPHVQWVQRVWTTWAMGHMVQ